VFVSYKKADMFSKVTIKSLLLRSFKSSFRLGDNTMP